MGKYILILTVVASFQSLYSQEDYETNVHREIDSLKKVLPFLRGIDKVDGMNMLAYKFSSLSLSWKDEADSAYPYVMKANTEAKKIGYKKGLGYSYLRLAYVKYLKYSFNEQKYNKKDAQLLNAIDQFGKLAISIGEELKDNSVLANSYYVLGQTEYFKNNHIQYVDYLQKAILYGEKSGKELQYASVFRFSPVCEGCVGNENWLARISEELAEFYISILNYKTANAHSKKAIEYFQKAGDKKRLASAYSSLARIHFRGFNYEASQNASKQCISLYHELGDRENEIRAYAELGKIFEISGDFENGLEHCTKSISLTESYLKMKHPNEKNEFYWGYPFFWTCRLYKIAGDYEGAMDIIRRGKTYFPDPMDDGLLEMWASEIGDIHRLMGNYDSAFFYLNRFSSKIERWNFGKVSLGNLYLDLKEYDKALELVIPVIQRLRKLLPMPPLANVLIIASNAALKKGDSPAALNYAREAHRDLNLMKGNVLMIKNHKLLSEIFNKLGQNDSAYFYLNQHTLLRDSLLNRQFYFRLNNYKKEAEEERKTSQINLLNKDNQLKEQKLKQQATLRNSLIAGILLLFLLGLFIFRNLLLKRKNEKLRMQKDFELKQLENEKKQTELEMQALRAQMNPHFIFNCLSSINRFILKNEGKTASNYLTRFSRLMRMVLMNSQKPLISLDNEFEMLGIYLEMERLRFKNSFDYKIAYLNAIDSDNVFIPPLLLQPVCENAIWHGLMHKEGGLGRLDIELSMQDDILNCTITDNGVGREKAEAMRSKTAEKEKSMGLKITSERLALLNREKSLHTFYEIEDLKDESGNAAGTKVTLKISFKEPIEENA